MKSRTCVSPEGFFLFGIHKPDYTTTNLREHDYIATLGRLPDNTPHDNGANFPAGDVDVREADWVYEIPNPFPFRGVTYISGSWAAARAEDPASIHLPPPEETSMTLSLRKLLKADLLDPEEIKGHLRSLPRPLRLTLASTSTDPRDLAALAEISCAFVRGPEEKGPSGLRYEKKNKRVRPLIHDPDLFEAVANNPLLPDAYKEVMVLRPGAQGRSEIVGEVSGPTHVFEYLRRNSYIPWGHYASNMAHDAVRYSTEALGAADMTGLRHLYYQRTYVRLAQRLGIALPAKRKTLAAGELENLRQTILKKIKKAESLPFTGTLWGWNYGFDYAGSGYRLHASHQQIHQQFALLPPRVQGWRSGSEAAGTMPSFGCGDQVAEFCRQYREQTGKNFFATYIRAIRDNRRLDERKGAKDLVVYEDDRVMLFAPKAQTSQWELQLMTVKEVGNILETDARTRESLDRAMLVAQKILAALGARLVTSIEYSKRMDNPDTDQRLLYAFLPKLPHSMGAFSEAQLRWVNSHFPEDFAAACRKKLSAVLREITT